MITPLYRMHRIFSLCLNLFSILFLISFWTFSLQANPAPGQGPNALSTFGVNPIYSPGIKPTMIVDEFGAIDSSLTQQQQDEIKKKISEWKADGISYGAYYNLTRIESSLQYSLSTGAQVNPDGSLVTGNDGQVFYNMTPTRTAFRDYLVNSGKLAIDLGADHIFLDVASIDFYKFSFDDDVTTAFASYIGEGGYDIKALVLNAGFNLSQNINENNGTLTGDAHWQQWIDYDKVIERNFFSDWSTALKNYAASKGQTVNLSANRYLDSSQPGDSWISAEYFDHTIAETFLDTLGYREKDLNYGYKVSVAYGKRFWSWNFPNNTDALDDGATNGSDNQPVNNLDRVFVAQCFANGGLSQAAGAGWVNYLTQGVKPVKTVADYQLVQKHAELFNHSEASQMAVLYGEFGINNDPGGLNESFKGATYLLSDAHRTWDVLFVSDPNRLGYTTDQLTLAKLNQYKGIVIPHLQQLSAAQITLIESYLNADASHTVIGFGTVATHTASNGNAPGSRVFDDLFGIDATDTATYTGTVVAFASDLGLSQSQNSTNATTRANNVTSFETNINTYVAKDITTNLPPTLQITRYVDASDSSNIYHLVNTNHSFTGDAITLASGNLTVNLPPGFVGEPIFTQITPESPVGVVISASSSGIERTIALSNLNTWSIVKVGSAAATPTSVDNYPWSQIHLHDTAATAADDDFSFGGNRPDALDSMGAFNFPYWYWYGGSGSDNALPLKVGYLATDDNGLQKIDLYYRYSSDYSSWSGWQLLLTNTPVGSEEISSFSQATAPNGDGYYEFYTVSTDSSGQVERSVDGAETGHGIDTAGPGLPQTFFENGGAVNGVWQSGVTSPVFAWTNPSDNLSGPKDAWMDIINVSTSSTIGYCSNIDLTSVTSIDPTTCGTALSTPLGSGLYKVKFRSKDVATNSSSNADVFDLRVGTKSVQDVTDILVAPGNGSVTVSWTAPVSLTNFDEVRIYAEPTSSLSTVWSITASGGIGNPVTDTSLTINGLTNGTNYRIAVESFDRTANLPGDMVVPNCQFTPRLTNPTTTCASIAVTITESGGLTAVAEGGAIDTYTVQLGTMPTATVTVNPTLNSQLGFSPSALNFTTGNWSTPQTVSVFATDDTDVEGNHNASLEHSVSSSDVNYNGLMVAALNVSITDNDSVATSPAPDASVPAPADGGNTASAGGGGGCSIGKYSATDPTLILLFFMALIYKLRGFGGRRHL